MSQRVSLGGGKYCYTGANCSWHSPNGINAARRGLRLAEQKLANSSTFEELVEAKEFHAAARKQYDATSEGQEAIAREIQGESDPIERAALELRLNNARALATEREESVTPVGNAPLSEFFANPHSYEEPTVRVVNDGTMYPSRVGSNFVQGDSVADVAKKLRAEIKKAEEAGYLPSSLNYRVTHSKADRSVDVTVEGLEDREIVTQDGDRTPVSRNLQDRLGKITNSYISDSSNSMIDYHSSSHSSHVGFENSAGRAYRENQSRLSRETAQTASLRKQLKEDNGSYTRAELSEKYDLSFDSARTLSSGEQYSPVKGHDSIIAVRREDGKVGFYNTIGMNYYDEMTRERFSAHEVLDKYNLVDFRTKNITSVTVEG